MAPPRPEEKFILAEILEGIQRDPPMFPSEPEFRVKHAAQRAVMDELLGRQAISRKSGYYILTFAGLRTLGTDDARRTIRRCNSVIEWLKEKVGVDPRKPRWTIPELCEGSTFSKADMQVFITIILVSGEQPIASGWSATAESPFITEVQLRLDGVLDAGPVPETEVARTELTSGPASVSRIYIHNFRSFVNFEWKPPAVSALVGSNGSGKTALVEVLWALQDLLVDGKSIDEAIPQTSRTAWLSDAEQTFEIDIDRQGTTFHYRLSVVAERGRGSINEELHGVGGLLYRAQSGRVELFGDPPVQAPRATIPFDRKRSFLAALEPRADNAQIIVFRELVAGIWAMKPDACRISGSASAESRFLLRDLSNFASWYLSRVAEDLDAATALRDDLEDALHGFKTMRFEPISSNVKDLRVRFAYGKHTYELPWELLSDGQRLLIALYGLLRFGLPTASLIVLDEAESYVAPSEIQPWFRAVVDSVAERKQQLVVVSHHPESINYLAADAVLRMWRDLDGGHTRIAPLSPDAEAGETAYDALKLREPNCGAAEDDE
jgi:predicted ATPase